MQLLHADLNNKTFSVMQHSSHGKAMDSGNLGDSLQVLPCIWPWPLFF